MIRNDVGHVLDASHVVCYDKLAILVALEPFKVPAKWFSAARSMCLCATGGGRIPTCSPGRELSNDPHDIMQQKYLSALERRKVCTYGKHPRSNYPHIIATAIHTRKLRIPSDLRR
jgi:hypothetical protein